MKNLTTLGSALSDPPVPFTDQLRLAVAAYLARFKGSFREHTESDLRCYLTWCAERRPGPAGCPAPHLTRAPRCGTPKRARQNLDRHPNYILAACMASGT